MNLIRLSIDRPVAVIAAVIMALMFGYVALMRIPIQLAPDVARPVIEVRTTWPGAAPVEVEREILIPQEDAFKGLSGMESMIGRATRGESQLELEFAIGTDMDRALLLVSNRLDRVSNYPDEVKEPRIDTASSEDSPIAWFRINRTEGNNTPIYHYGDYLEEVVKPLVERVQGIGSVNVYGGSDRQLQIKISAERLASYQLTINEVVSALRLANVAISGGNIDEGKRNYVVRTDNEFKGPEAIKNIILRTNQGGNEGGALGRVALGDIADIDFGYSEIGAVIRANGKPALAMNATREVGVNVINVMRELQSVITMINEDYLAEQGLYISQVYDETDYIESAIDLVLQNIWIGGVLAVLVLMLFLRSVKATAVVAFAIPISVVSSFVAMAFLGRSLNVVSLAGIAFAVGMVVDAAIVVLENIYRLRQSGLSAKEAAFQGANRVWGAVMVSALTTILVFLPIMVMDLEVGQLFRDIAVAISVAVFLSLIVAVTVIPALSNFLLQKKSKTGKTADSETDHQFEFAGRVRLPIIDDLAEKFTNLVASYARFAVSHTSKASIIVAIIVSASLYTGYRFLPELEYLPEGNRNFVFGIIFPPPGYNLDTTTKIADNVERQILPLREMQEDGGPQIDNFFFVATPRNSFMGASSVDPARAGELVPLLSRPLFQEPGTFGFFTQPSIFGRGVGGARSISLDISGGELEDLITTARIAAGLIEEKFPANEGNQLRPRPGLELGAPELRILPDPIKLRDNNVSATNLGQSIDAFNDGLIVDEITINGILIDLVLKGEQDALNATQTVGQIPVVTGNGEITSVDNLADILLTAGPNEIRHTQRLRTITLELRPNPMIPLGSALTILQEEIVKPLQDGLLMQGQQVFLSGTADQLQKTWDEMRFDLLLALVIVFLVMAILFGNFLYPLIILVTVPTAAIGGVIGLNLLAQFQTQSLDMLTLLGFVILIGTVVNNAILVVHQALSHLRIDKMTIDNAVIEATRNRVRPIFMSTLTSVFGMLPLVLSPGAGSEIYRGLGSVVIGGLTLSSIVTLLLVPALLALALKLMEKKRA